MRRSNAIPLVQQKTRNTKEHASMAEKGTIGYGGTTREYRSCMKLEQSNNPLHGKTLETILHHLVNHYGWEQLGSRIKIKCFNENPSIQSSLKFLRKTPWARLKVEKLYLESIEN